MSTTSPSTDPPVRTGLPHEATPWVHVAAAVTGLTALLALILTGFAWPASNLAPRDLPIAVAGPPPAVAQVEQQLTAAGDDAFDVTAAASREAAVAAIEDRDVYGAIVIGETASELLTAPAASPVVAQLLVELSAQLAAAAPAGTPPPVVTEVVPLPADDPRGAGLAAGSLPLVLGGIATAAALALLVVGRLRRVVGALGAAVGAGLTLTAVLQFWLGSLDGSYLANSGIVSLGIAAIVTSVLGLHNVLGHAGLGLGALTMLLLGNPLSGITSAPELLPAGWGTLGQWLPPGAMGTVLRSTAFFDGAALGLPLTVLGLWLLAGLTMLLLPVRAARTSTAPAPAAASTNRLEASPPKM